MNFDPTKDRPRPVFWEMEFSAGSGKVWNMNHWQFLEFFFDDFLAGDA
jgi:hypothetical protein